MTRLDHNRAVAQVAARAGVPVASVTNLSIWGNHSATQYPDIFHAKVAGRPALEAVGGVDWVEKEMIPTVQQRGAAIIEARGCLERRFGRQRGHRFDAGLGAGHQPGRLDFDGRSLRRLLRDAGRGLLQFPGFDRRRVRTAWSRTSKSTSFLENGSTAARPNCSTSVTASPASGSCLEQLKAHAHR